MNKSLKIKEDWERESLKDFIYLQEQSHDLEEAINKEIYTRQPAQIVVIQEIKKPQEHEYNTLPF